MNKDEILAASRKENKEKDPVRLEIEHKGNGIAFVVLAFDEKDMATEWFVRDWLLNNELISMDELKEKTERYTAAWSEYARTKEALTSKEAEIEELKKQLEELENERYDLKKDELHTYAIAKKANAALNIKD